MSVSFQYGTIPVTTPIAKRISATVTATRKKSRRGTTRFLNVERGLLADRGGLPFWAWGERCFTIGIAILTTKCDPVNIDLIEFA